jgi:hypothetical protein
MKSHPLRDGFFVETQKSANRLWLSDANRDACSLQRDRSMTASVSVRITVMKLDSGDVT